MGDPTGAGLGLAARFTERSALLATVPVVTLVLLVRLGSSSVPPTTALLVNVPATLVGFTTMWTVTLAPLAREPMLSVTTPAKNCPPSVETNDELVGSVSVRTTPVASWGPL